MFLPTLHWDCYLACQPLFSGTWMLVCVPVHRRQGDSDLSFPMPLAPLLPGWTGKLILLWPWPMFALSFFIHLTLFSFISPSLSWRLPTFWSLILHWDIVPTTAVGWTDRLDFGSHCSGFPKRRKGPHRCFHFPFPGFSPQWTRQTAPAPALGTGTGN